MLDANSTSTLTPDSSGGVPLQQPQSPAQATLACAQALESRFDFRAARELYRRLVSTDPDGLFSQWARDRLVALEWLIEEKAAYERIHQNAVRVLSHIGVNLADSEPIMEALMAADAIDFENQDAVFVPLRVDYVESCLQAVPRQLPMDPGINAFGTGATPPFLKREEGRRRSMSARPQAAFAKASTKAYPGRRSSIAPAA